MAHPNTLANLRPWTPEDRAHRGQPFRNAQTVLIQYIRHQSKDGAEMVDFMFAVLRGETIKAPGLKRKRAVPTIRDRMHAADWLANRAFGLPKETIEVSDPEGARQERLTLLAKLPSEARQALRAILSEALAAQALAPRPIAPEANGGPHA